MGKAARVGCGWNAGLRRAGATNGSPPRTSPWQEGGRPQVAIYNLIWAVNVQQGKSLQETGSRPCHIHGEENTRKSI